LYPRPLSWRCGLLRPAARHDAILDVAAGEFLERARRELLLTALGAVAGEFVQHTGVLRGDENREVLVRRMDRDFVRSEYAHGSRPHGVRYAGPVSGLPMSAVRRVPPDFGIERADQIGKLR